MLTFQIEKVRAVFPMVATMGLAHWHETETYRHNQPYKPDLERYAYYEDEGMYVMYTARDENNLVVGNLGMYVSESMHSQQLIATEDTLFLVPQYRKGRNAMRLIKFMVDDMRSRGVVEILVTAKNVRVGRLLEHLDFKPVASQYSLTVAPTARVSTLPVGEPVYDAASKLPATTVVRATAT